MRSIKTEHISVTDIGLVREANEDSCGSIEGVNGQVFTVCDGMGGHVGGAVASSLAVKSLLEFVTTATVDNPSVTINNAIISANQKLLAMIQERPDLKGMGTTTTLLTVQPNGIYFGHVGDSRIYIFSNGKLHRLTKDHSFVQTLLDSGAITPEEAAVHPRKNELTTAMGASDTIQPTVVRHAVKPKPGDIFLLCTDGLCGLVDDTLIEKIVSANQSLDRTAQELIQAAKNAGGFDNITVQLIKVVESPYNRSEFESFSMQPATPTTRQNFASPSQPTKPAGRWQKIPVKALFLTVLVLAIGGIAYYFLKPHPMPDPNKNNPAKENATIYLAGDTIENGYLIHTIRNTETLEKLIEERKKTSKNIYKQYNFDSTYALDGFTRVDQKTFGNYINTRIKWKKNPTTSDAGPEKDQETGTDTAGNETGKSSDVHKIVVKADQAPPPPPVTTHASAPEKETPLQIKLKEKDKVVKDIAALEVQIQMVKDSLGKKKVAHVDKDHTIKELKAKLKKLHDNQTIIEKQINELNKKGPKGVARD